MPEIRELTTETVTFSHNYLSLDLKVNLNDKDGDMSGLTNLEYSTPDGDKIGIEVIGVGVVKVTRLLPHFIGLVRLVVSGDEEEYDHRVIVTVPINVIGGNVATATVEIVGEVDN